MIDHISAEQLVCKNEHPDNPRRKVTVNVVSVYADEDGAVLIERKPGNFALVPQTRLFIECPVCDGLGDMYDVENNACRCPACNGDGEVSLFELSPRPFPELPDKPGEVMSLHFALARLEAKWDMFDIQQERRLQAADRAYEEGR